MSDEDHFDHGAQYFTARDPRFARYIEAWGEAGLVAPWEGRIVAMGKDGTVSPVTPVERYVGVPGMNAMAKHLARDVDRSAGCSVTELRRDVGRWYLQTGAGETLSPFDVLVLAVPPEQADRLSAPVELLDTAERVDLLPCWCAVAALDTPLPLEFGGAFANDAVLDWVARDSSKPGRPAGERWVIHASAPWAATRLADSPDDVAHALLARFFSVLGLSPRAPEHLAGHRWSFARPEREGQAECLWREEHPWPSAGTGVAAAGAVAHQGIG